jgi:hypothetical protein
MGNSCNIQPSHTKSLLYLLERLPPKVPAKGCLQQWETFTECFCTVSEATCRQQSTDFISQISSILCMLLQRESSELTQHMIFNCVSVYDKLTVANANQISIKLDTLATVFRWGFSLKETEQAGGQDIVGKCSIFILQCVENNLKAVTTNCIGSFISLLLHPLFVSGFTPENLTICSILFTPLLKWKRIVDIEYVANTYLHKIDGTDQKKRRCTQFLIALFLFETIQLAPNTITRELYCKKGSHHFKAILKNFSDACSILEPENSEYFFSRIVLGVSNIFKTLTLKHQIEEFLCELFLEFQQTNSDLTSLLISLIISRLINSLSNSEICELKSIISRKVNELKQEKGKLQGLLSIIQKNCG